MRSMETVCVLRGGYARAVPTRMLCGDHVRAAVEKHVARAVWMRAVCGAPLLSELVLAVIT